MALKRDKIEQLGVWAGHIAVIAVIAVPILSAFGYNPFYMKADAQALAENVASNTSRIKMVEQRLEGIEETTAWNLQITLQNSLSQLRVSLMILHYPPLLKCLCAPPVRRKLNSFSAFNKVLGFPFYQLSVANAFIRQAVHLKPWNL